MTARLLITAPSGKHARLGVTDRLWVALARLLETAPRVLGALLTASLCIGVGLGALLMAVIW